MRAALQQEQRLLPLPPCYYVDPFPTYRFKNYGMEEFFKHLIAIFREAANAKMAVRRMLEPISLPIRLSFFVRTLQLRRHIRLLERFSRVLAEDKAVVSFNNSDTNTIPPYYDWVLDKRLGRYAGLLLRQDRDAMAVD
ncbi:hypothetical protein MesoLj113b_29370 [Mesorhizobium sp. 113-3-3]|nr:hypothetical protein MesoLj113b_29370 [Mesorhizobium sp. 113-3-3]